jgi:competence protein ComEC
LKSISTIILITLLVLVTFPVKIQSNASSATSSIVLATSSPENATIYFLDVGQGDSILIKTSTKNVLIDGGPTAAGTTLLNYLSAYNVTKIDLLVGTHPHEDHIGGLISVMQSTITIQDIIYNGYNYTSTQTFNTWKTLALTHNLTQASRNQVYAMSPSINFTVLSPTSPTQFSDLNAESIVMKLQVGNTSVLLTGDATNDAEASMLSSGFNLRCQVLKVGHHGSSYSTSLPFLTTIKPTYAIISAGLNNQYGHPSQQTLDSLSSNNITTYGTYKDGTAILSLNSASASPTPTPFPTPSPNQTPVPTSTHSQTPTPSATIAPTSSAPTAPPTLALTIAPTQTPSPEPTSTPNPTLTVSLSESASALNYGNTVNLTVLADGGTKPYTYTWYIDNQLAQTSGSPYYSTNTQSVGSHHVYVQVTDAASNSATTLTVEFNVLPVSSSSPNLNPTPSPSIPEFPSFILLSFLVVTVISTAIFCKRKHSKLKQT